jgi:hypothetical protein
MFRTYIIKTILSSSEGWQLMEKTNILTPVLYVPGETAVHCVQCTLMLNIITNAGFLGGVIILELPTNSGGECSYHTPIREVLSTKKLSKRNFLRPHRPPEPVVSVVHQQLPGRLSQV